MLGGATASAALSHSRVHGRLQEVLRVQRRVRPLSERSEMALSPNALRQLEVRKRRLAEERSEGQAHEDKQEWPGPPGRIGGTGNQLISGERG